MTNRMGHEATIPLEYFEALLLMVMSYLVFGFLRATVSTLLEGSLQARCGVA
jgi:hypothetical protein